MIIRAIALAMVIASLVMLAVTALCTGTVLIDEWFAVFGFGSLLFVVITRVMHSLDSREPVSESECALECPVCALTGHRRPLPRAMVIRR